MIACVTLVILVLLQSGKEGMGVIFGGGGGSVFGSTGAGNLLSKLTAGAAIVFFITTMTFTYLSTQQHTSIKESIVLDMPVPTAPAATAAPVGSDDQNVQSETVPADQPAEPAQAEDAQ